MRVQGRASAERQVGGSENLGQHSAAGPTSRERVPHVPPPQYGVQQTVRTRLCTRPATKRQPWRTCCKGCGLDRGQHDHECIVRHGGSSSGNSSNLQPPAPGAPDSDTEEDEVAAPQAPAAAAKAASAQSEAAASPPAAPVAPVVPRAVLLFAPGAGGGTAAMAKADLHPQLERHGISVWRLDEAGQCKWATNSPGCTTNVG